MDSKKYEIYCRFSALGKKVIQASSLDDAIQIAESDEKVEFDDIVRVMEPCKVDQKLSHEVIEDDSEEPHNIEFKNWGSE
ncbi:MAG TPA: hypothetical protein ENN33_09820 [Ignavibacteria bacterium]|nr:hypothetical protein [Ignavibacteria bacterium]